MAHNLFLTSTDSTGNKDVVKLGLMDLLVGRINKVGYFKPIINGSTPQEINDNFLLINNHYNLGLRNEDMFACTMTEAEEFVSNGKYDDLLSLIVDSYKKIEEKCDFVLCEGTDYDPSTAAFEMEINGRIAALISSPVLLISGGPSRDTGSFVQNTKMAMDSLTAAGCEILGTIATDIPEDRRAQYLQVLKSEVNDSSFISVLPESKNINAPTILEINNFLDGTLLFGEEQQHKQIHRFSIGNMNLENYIWGLSDGMMIITTGDRLDIILAAHVVNQADNFPEIGGLILTGEHPMDNVVPELLKGLQRQLPILVVRDDIYTVTQKLQNLKSKILEGDKRKIAQALSIFETYVDKDELAQLISAQTSKRVTPKMFEYNLIQRAKSEKKHIVLPEGLDDRILKATEVLLTREVVDITLLGDVEKVNNRIHELGLNMSSVKIIDPANSKDLKKYATVYFEMRKHKGVKMEDAMMTMKDVSYYGTMMVHLGDADGMVSGAVHSTAHTIRPAFQIIKTKPNCPIVSSAFLMCLEDRVLVYGDCAVNPNPNSEELAHIAISSAETAEIFGIESRVAMLSYSSGDSGKGEDVELVRNATKIARDLEPHLKLEGPIQYDAAVSKSVAKTKMPDSEVAGKATIFIFPDLNTGNNTYKAVQRETGAIAIGPLLQGLNKPVNDLSRGCLIPDIINTVIITAIQSQNTKGDL